MADWSDITHAAGDTDYIANLNTLVTRAEDVATEVEALALVVGSPGSPGDLPVTDFGVGTLTGGQLLRANAAASALEGVTLGQTQTLTGATTLGVADAGKVVQMTGTWALGFAPAATLGANWNAEIRNAGSGIITVDPNGSELIDGLSSFAMYPGEWRRVWSTGTALVSVVVRPFVVEFLSSGTFVKPPGYALFSGLLWGGGGSGGKHSSGGGGGGGGGCTPFSLSASALAATETVTLGAGGAAKTVPSYGAVGGNSTLGSLVTAYGGGGGSSGAPTTGGGGGLYGAGTDSGGGAPGGSTVAATASVYGGGYGGGTAGRGQSVYGGGWKTLFGGASGGDSSTLTAGTSQFGGAGGAGSNTATNAEPGIQPGGGGGGTASGTASGAGAAGGLRIWGVV